MRSKSSYPTILVTISFLLLVLLGFGTVFWCQFAGGCKFGKYQAKVTLTDAQTQEPLANMVLMPTSRSGTPGIANNIQKGQTVTTDNKGQAIIEFSRVFDSALTIDVFSESPKTRSMFGFTFYLKDIREHTTLSDIDTQYFYSEGRDKGEIKLVLEVGDWSLF
jgi:hypothetical protein